MILDDLRAMVIRRTPELLAAHLPERDHTLARRMGQKNRKVKAISKEQKKWAAKQWRTDMDSLEIADELLITVESLRNLMCKMGVKRR